MSALYLHVLGTAAGGGLPQWNCACGRCSAARSGAGATPPRRHESLAVRSGDIEGFIINATPDLPAQIERTPWLHPGPGARDTPVRRVLLTDGNLDHVLGLYGVRNGQSLEVMATAEVLTALHEDLGLGAVLESYLSVSWVELPTASDMTLPGSPVRVRIVPTGRRPPRYVRAAREGAWSVAFEISSPDGKRAVYAPVIAEWTDALDRACRGADCIFADGTFWQDDEPRVSGCGSQTAREMGHLPISGDHGTLSLLAASDAGRRLYTHINNTNPVVDACSDERGVLREHGLEVASDDEVLVL